MRPVQLAILMIFAAALAGCEDDPPLTPPDMGAIVDTYSSLDGQLIDDATWVFYDTLIKPDLNSTPDTSVIVDSQTIDTVTKPDLNKQPDLSSQPDTSPACPSAKPTGYCNAATAPVCSYGNDICKCITVCGGQRPPPGQTHHWVCEPPQPTACPKSAPTAGAICSPNGLKCKYGICSLTIADCISSKWKVQVIPPPP